MDTANNSEVALYQAFRGRTSPAYRFAGAAVAEALEDTRVVVLEGARQVGKSTLAGVIARQYGGLVTTLDDATTRQSAEVDPTSFVRQQPNGLLVIDEIQRVRELLLAVKAEADANPRPGRFLLTGSADLLALGGVDSLAGRAQTVTLEGLSQGEFAGIRETFLDRVLAGDLFEGHHSPLTRGDYLVRACVGGFPEAALRESERRRSIWFRDYITRLTRRDAPDITGLTRLAELPRLVKYVAARSGSPFVMSSAANDLQVPRTSLAPYVSLLETLYVTRTVPAWSTSAVARATKHPKVFIRDPGLAAHLLGARPQSLAIGGAMERWAGPIVETFVVSELAKQLGWAANSVDLSHFRDQAGNEVDVIVQAADGQVAALEIKASASAGANDFLALARLRDRLGDRFQGGLVLYTGDRSVPFGPRLAAVPIDALWAPSPGLREKS
jgi:predicted AAA+ superfamily ATPase